MNEIEEIKRRVSPKLLLTKGVSGVGIQSGALTVYLAEDSDDVRRDVAALLEAEEPGTPVKFLVTGTFRAQ